MIYKLTLMTHLAGLSILFGTLVVSYFATGRIWKELDIDQRNAMTVANMVARFSKLFGIGIVIQILSGVAMVAMTRGAYGKQFWMQLKLIVIVLVIINALAFGRRQFNALAMVLSQGKQAGDTTARLMSVKRNLNLFYLMQLVFFLCILCMSVFKFN